MGTNTLGGAPSGWATSTPPPRPSLHRHAYSNADKTLYSVALALGCVGAGHDAQMLARVCPSAMIFVPSVGGLSHNVREHTEPEDLLRGAQLLLQVALARANRSS